MSDREEQGCRPISGVDWESGVKRLMGNEQLYRRLLSKFVSGYGDAGERVREALKAGERQKAHAELHTLKGVAQNLGFERLYQVSAVLTEAMRGEKPLEDRSLLDAVEQQDAVIRRAISELE